MRTLRLLPLALALAIAPAPGAAVEVELRTAAQDSAPKYFTRHDGSMGGLCVAILRAVERVAPGVRFEGYERFQPFKRLQWNLETGALDVFFGLRRTPRREGRFRFVDVPLYGVRYVMLARAGDPGARRLSADLRSFVGEGTILTVAGAAAARFLTDRERLSVDDSAKNPGALVRMLLAKRGRFAFYHHLGLHHAIAEESIGSAVSMLPFTYLAYHHHVAFSNAVPDEVVTAVRAALLTLESSGELEAMRRTFGAR